MAPTSSAQQAAPLASITGAWQRLREEAATQAQSEPSLASHLHAAVLNHASLADALAYVLGAKLGGEYLNAMQVREVCADVLARSPEIVEAVAADLDAVRERDAACHLLLQPFLYFKGFQALQAYRIAHALWSDRREVMAYYWQNRITEQYDVDVHPGARIGKGVMIDHATSVVIGETAIIGDDCSLLHEVTLGGTGAKRGDRHPKVGKGVLIGAGAKVLGNITVGDYAKIAAGSVVLKDVAPRCTVAGVPAIPIGGAGCDEPARSMMQDIGGWEMWGPGAGI